MNTEACLFERSIWERAHELCADQAPEFNIIPTVELIRKARSMGYDVIKSASPARSHDTGSALIPTKN